ncbi:hypothetical protein [Tahibacter soli]|uniref:Uncharacterized protein n=1 Tax=Tahibacter soli TaxID=2983605 RepID=A0A9X4BM89_9GAMM|nr:hypothetical protein [Tahibacter soli]MDC8015044.1 hypothetical protein [Tahibacter soli]
MLEACAQLLEKREFERYVVHLFQQVRGDWSKVAPALERLEINIGSMPNSIFAAWLDSPQSGKDYVFIIFYDDDSGGVISAEYNRARLTRVAK